MTTIAKIWQLSNMNCIACIDGMIPIDTGNLQDNEASPCNFCNGTSNWFYELRQGCHCSGASKVCRNTTWGDVYYNCRQNDGITCESKSHKVILCPACRGENWLPVSYMIEHNWERLYKIIYAKGWEVTYALDQKWRIFDKGEILCLSTHENLFRAIFYAAKRKFSEYEEWMGCY